MTGTVTTPQLPRSETPLPLLAASAVTLAGAAVVNLALFAIGSAAGGSMSVHWPIDQAIAVAAVPIATLVPTALAAVITWAIARQRPGFATLASRGGLVVAVLSAIVPLIGGDDLVTRLTVAPMHVVAGVALLLTLRRFGRRG